jgi:hypothetical protein
MVEQVTQEAINEFFDESFKEQVSRLGKDLGKGLPDSASRFDTTAFYARKIVREAIGECFSELPTVADFNFSVEADRIEFLDAMRSGATLAVVEIGGDSDNQDYFDVLRGLDPESLAWENSEEYRALIAAADEAGSEEAQIDQQNHL